MKSKQKRDISLYILGLSIIFMGIVFKYTYTNSHNTASHNKITISSYTIENKWGSRGDIVNSHVHYVSSLNGSKYYPINCVAVNRIKEENRIYYATADEARRDDREPSSVCD